MPNHSATPALGLPFRIELNSSHYQCDALPVSYGSMGPGLGIEPRSSDYESDALPLELSRHAAILPRFLLGWPGRDCVA